MNRPVSTKPPLFQHPMASMGRRVERTGGFAAAALLVAGALAACQGPGAPTDPGVCWRATGGGFEILGRHVSSLDNCAAQLEALHLQGARRADGAFQGYYLFIDDRQIASSDSLRGFRYPIFQPGQRAEIDADLRALIRDRAGRAPGAGDIAVERR